MMTSSGLQLLAPATGITQDEVFGRAQELRPAGDSATALGEAGSASQPDFEPLTLEQRDALFLEFAPLVRRLLRQYAGSDAEMREDMRGELYYRFSVLCQEYDASRGVPLRPYIIRKLTAAAYTFARQSWRRDRRELSFELGEELGEQGPSVDPTGSWNHVLAMQQVLRALPDGISQLPTRQRKLVVARYYEQRSFEEIAESLDIRVSTARSILRHGLNNLRKWIQREKLDWVD